MNLFCTILLPLFISLLLFPHDFLLTYLTYFLFLYSFLLHSIYNLLYATIIHITSSSQILFLNFKDLIFFFLFMVLHLFTLNNPTLFLWGFNQIFRCATNSLRNVCYSVVTTSMDFVCTFLNSYRICQYYFR